MKVWSICLHILWIYIWTAILLESPLIDWMGYEWNTKGKNYILPLQCCSTLRKKINTKLYLTRLILTLKNFPFTPEVLDSNFNILIYYIFTVFYYFNIYSGLLSRFGLYSCTFCRAVISAIWKSISLRGCIATVLLYVFLLPDSGFAQKLKHAASYKLI